MRFSGLGSSLIFAGLAFCGFIRFCPPSLISTPRSVGLQSGHDLLSCDRMLPDSNAACVMDGVRNGARNGPNCSLAETLRSIKPSWLQAIDKYLRLLRHVHDCGNSVRQVPDAIVACAREFPIPWNRISRHLCALDQ